MELNVAAMSNARAAQSLSMGRRAAISAGQTAKPSLRMPSLASAFQGFCAATLKISHSTCGSFAKQQVNTPVCAATLRIFISTCDFFLKPLVDVCVCAATLRPLGSVNVAANCPFSTFGTVM